MFSVVYAGLLKPLPYAHAERLVQLSELNATQGADDGRVSRGTFVDWSARTRTLESLGAYSSGGESLWTIGDRLQVVRVAAGLHPDVFLPSLVIRTSLPSAAVAAVIRERIGAYDPQLLVQRLQPMDE